MQQISVLQNLHDNETAWIFGKGPSLDEFAMENAGKLRICINESLLCVSSPTYFFSHDEGPIGNVAKTWPNACSAILQPVRARYAVDKGIPAAQILTYEKRFCDHSLRDASAGEIAKRSALFGNSGTVHCAIHFCRLIGANHITMVGFDGSGGYAQKLKMPDGGAAHERIRRDSISLLEAMNFSYDFFTVSSC